MGVTNRTLVALGLVAAALTGAALLRPAPDARTAAAAAPSPARAAERALRDSVFRLRTRLGLSRTSRFVDSVQAGLPTADASSVLVIGRGAARLRPAAERLLAGMRLPERPEVPVQVVLVDSALAPEPRSWQGTLFATLPDSNGPRRCSIVLVVGANPGLQDWEVPPGQRPTWGGVESACWYWASFGAPGAGVRAWLGSRSWLPARVLPADVPLALDRADLLGPRDLRSRIAGDDRGVFLGGSIGLEACARERVDACEAGFLGPVPARDSWVPAGIVPRPMFAIASGWQQGLSSRVTERLLALMAAELGAGQFEAFWRSDLPVGEAFRAATGVSFGVWYGARIRGELVAAGVGNPLRLTSWIATAGYALLALALAMLRVQRRQVG